MGSTTSLRHSTVRSVPSYAPCPCQGICIACSLLLALLRCHLRVSGMFSRYHQQPVLAGGALLILPFAFHHYTYLIDGADLPLRHNVHKKSIWLSVQRNRRDDIVTYSIQDSASAVRRRVSSDPPRSPAVRASIAPGADIHARHAPDKWLLIKFRPLHLMQTVKPNQHRVH